MDLQLTTYAVGLVPVVIALVELIKRAGFPSKWCGLLSLGLGLCSAMLFLPGEVIANSFQGILIGLSAAGLYSGARALVV